MSDDETCCNRPLRVDPDRAGETCGGLAVKGALVCDICGAAYVARIISMPAKADGTAWTLAASNRSLNCGGIRVRAEGKADAGEIEALMARLQQLPDLERELEVLRRRLIPRSNVTPALESK